MKIASLTISGDEVFVELQADDEIACYATPPRVGGRRRNNSHASQRPNCSPSWVSKSYGPELSNAEALVINYERNQRHLLEHFAEMEAICIDDYSSQYPLTAPSQLHQKLDLVVCSHIGCITSFSIRK